MKKSYIKPSTEKIVLEYTHYVLSTSLETKDGEAKEWGSRRRGHNVWEDDEEEEDY